MNKAELAFPMLDPNGGYTQYGLSKREYFAASYASVAVSFFNDTSSTYILEYLGLPKDTKYDAKYYNLALVRYQLEMADLLMESL